MRDEGRKGDNIVRGPGACARHTRRFRRVDALR
nr:MAG TPA: hypothetical protein [Caudoviricetes sp.]